jgi:hypothetical protein
MPDTGTVTQGIAQLSIQPTTVQSLTMGKQADLIVSELHGTGYVKAYGGSMFMGSNQAVVATALQTGLTATATGGLILSNPLSNNKNLVVRSAAIGLLVAQTNASVMGLMLAYSPSVAIGGTLTVVASQNCLPQTGGVASGILYSSASVTLQSTPILARVIGSFGTGALTTQTSSGIGPVDLQDSIIIQPGAALAFYGTGAGTASSLLFSYVWSEIAI